eukprot:1119808-Rhodomonas_salina.6
MAGPGAAGRMTVYHISLAAYIGTRRFTWVGVVQVAAAPSLRARAQDPRGRRPGSDPPRARPRVGLPRRLRVEGPGLGLELRHPDARRPVHPRPRHLPQLPPQVVRRVPGHALPGPAGGLSLLPARRLAGRRREAGARVLHRAGLGGQRCGPLGVRLPPDMLGCLCAPSLARRRATPPPQRQRRRQLPLPRPPEAHYALPRSAPSPAPCDPPCECLTKRVCCVCVRVVAGCWMSVASPAAGAALSHPFTAIVHNAGSGCPRACAGMRGAQADARVAGRRGGEQAVMEFVLKVNPGQWTDKLYRVSSPAAIRLRASCAQPGTHRSNRYDGGARRWRLATRRPRSWSRVSPVGHGRSEVIVTC